MNPFDKYNNQADVVSIDKWLAQQQALNKAKKNPQKKQSGNFLTHLLPTIGGTGGGVAGGAAGGAIAGSAILPGVGTVAGGLLGALLGGAAGGAGGKVLENKVEGKSLGSGVAGQGLEQGVLSAGPLRLLKAASTGAKGVKAGISLTDALETAAAGNAAKSGGIAKNLVTQGQAMQGRVAGISAGSKVNGKELSTRDTTRMLKVLGDEKLKIGNANNLERDISDKLGLYGKQIGNHIAQNNAPLSKTEVNRVANDYVKSLNTSDPRVLKEARFIANDLKNSVKDKQSLWEFRKALDDRIPDAKQAGGDAALSYQLKAVKKGRQFLSKQLGDIPGANNYHSLSEIKPFALAEAKRLNNPGGGIVGRIAASGPVQKVESTLGKGTEKVGSALGGAPSVPNANPFSLSSVAKRTVPVGGLQAALGSLSEQNANMANQQPSIQDIQNYDVSPDSGLTGGQAEQGGSPYTQESLIADIKRDPKNADKYIQNFKDLQDIFAPADATKGLNSTAAGVVADTTTGLNSLSDLYDAIGNSSANNPIIGKLRGLNPLDSNAQSLQQQIAATKQIVGKALEGGVLRAEDEKKYAKILPTLNDTDAVAKAKIQQIYSLISQRLNTYQQSLAGGNGGQTDLTSALLAAQGGY